MVFMEKVTTHAPPRSLLVRLEAVPPEGTIDYRNADDATSRLVAKLCRIVRSKSTDHPVDRDSSDSASSVSHASSGATADLINTGWQHCDAQRWASLEE
jgi:hypothetical protein